MRNSATKAANEHRRSELLPSLDPQEQLLMVKRVSSVEPARASRGCRRRLLLGRVVTRCTTTRTTDEEAKFGHPL
jgi:hypothetical protein